MIKELESKKSVESPKGTARADEEQALDTVPFPTPTTNSGVLEASKGGTLKELYFRIMYLCSVIEIFKTEMFQSITIKKMVFLKILDSGSIHV